MRKILNKFFIILISLSLACPYSTCTADEMKSLLRLILSHYECMNKKSNVHQKPVMSSIERFWDARNISILMT